VSTVHKQPGVGNPTDIAAWLEAKANTTKKYFDEVYGKQKIELILLATHQEYQRRGAGAKLVTWGMEMASEHGKTTVVIGSPAGKELYLRLGFKLVGDFHVQLDGEEDKMEFCALAYEPDQNGEVESLSVNTATVEKVE
jgi:predicted N-acetyltransferase YhbS